MIVSIPATQLRRGMQTWRYDAKRKTHVRDVKLIRPFITSLRFPHLAWEVSDGTSPAKVVYSPCSKVLVSQPQ